MNSLSQKFEELIGRIKNIPTESANKYILNLTEMANFPNTYDIVLEYLPKLDLNYYDNDLLAGLFSSLLSAHPPNRSILDLYDYFSGKLKQFTLIELIIRDPMNSIALIPYFSMQLMQNPEQFNSLVSDAIIAISNENQISDHVRSFRQFLFNLSIKAKNHRLCMDIIRSISISSTESDFYEFSSYVTLLMRILADNETIAQELFSYLMNASELFFNDSGLAHETWIISTATSFAPLLFGKTTHPAILDYTKFFTTYFSHNQEYYSKIRTNTQVKKSIQKRLQFNTSNLSRLISQFEEKSKPIYNKSLPLISSPPLLRPYYLFQLWHLDIYQICKSKDAIKNSSEDIYNSILNIIKNIPNSSGRHLKDLPSYQRILSDFISQLPIETSLPFYYLLAQKGYEDDFNTVIAKALSECTHSTGNGLLNIILKILEKIARQSPALLKPHFQLIGQLDISACANLISILIKGNILSFSSIWPKVKSLPFSTTKPIVREGILQIQRRSRSYENAQFILNTLRHYFAKPSSNEINWSAVAEAFPDDFHISSTILLNDQGGQNSNKTPTPLLQWREQFMKYVTKSPAMYHRIFSVPYLLLCTGDNEMPKENVKWAVSNLPAFQNQAEEILEGYVIFEIAKHILDQNSSSAQSLNLLNELFGYEKNTISKYAQTFVHAAITLNIGTKESLLALFDAVKSKHLTVSSTAKLALNFLKASGFLFESEHKDLVEKVNNPLVDYIVSLLLNKPLGDFNVSKLFVKESDQKFIDILLKAHNMNVESISAALHQTSFSNFNDVRNHINLLSISCFLLLPSRSVADSSIERCGSLLQSPSSQNAQKNFALLALAQVHNLTDDVLLGLNKLLDNKELHKPLAFFAAKHNNIELLSKLFSESDDYTLLQNIKPILAFMDQNLLLNFILKTAEKANLQDLFSSIAYFQNPLILNAIFTSIRKRPIIDIIQSRQYQNLRTGITKFGNSDDIEKYIFTPFDDFALLSMIEYDATLVRIIRGLASDNCQVTLPVLFILLLQKQRKMSELADALFSYVQASEAHETVKILKYLSLFYLVGTTSEPFETIRFHFETNPKELSDDLLLSILPSLLTRNITNSMHFEILKNANQIENNRYLNESVESLRLKNLK